MLPDHNGQMDQVYDGAIVLLDLSDGLKDFAIIITAVQEPSDGIIASKEDLNPKGSHVYSRRF